MADPARVLKLPYRGAPQTVSVIQDAALRSQNYYTVRQFVERTCEGLRSKDYLSEMLALLQVAACRTRYMRDPRTIELVRAPYLVVEELVQGRTPGLDCDDLAAFIGALLLMAGCYARIVTVAFKNMFYLGQRQFSHVFAQGQEPRTQRWVTLDPVPVNSNEMLRRVVAAKVWPLG